MNYRLLLGCLFSSLLALAATTRAMPLEKPRVDLSGFTGNGSPSSEARGAVLLPLLRSSDGLWHGDLQGGYASDHAWFAGLGGGYRQIISNTQLLGGYLFLDRSISPHHQSFLSLNPGVEWIGTHWRFGSNAYIPLGPREKALGRLLGEDRPQFTGHQEYDPLYQQIEEVGYGFDAQVAHTLSRRFTPYLGGYFFQPKQTSQIWGTVVGLDYAVNSHLSIGFKNIYDRRRHNTAMVGIKFSWGGAPLASPVIAEHLNDSIERHIATSGIGSAVPIIHQQVDTGQIVLGRDNIQFFEPNGQSQACTYEAPCNSTQFNQDAVNRIQQQMSGANFYLAQGDYKLGRQLFLYPGQSLFGRTPDFKQMSVGDNRPLLQGGLVLTGNNTLSAIRLINANAGQQRNGIIILYANHVFLDNIEVGSLEPSSNYRTGINIQSSEDVTIRGSKIYAQSVDNGTDITPVAALNIRDSGAVRVEDTFIDARRTLYLDPKSPAQQAEVFGVLADYSTVNLLNNTIHTSGEVVGKPGGEGFFGMSVVGLGVQYDSQVTANQNHFDLNLLDDQRVSNQKIQGVQVEAAELTLQDNTFHLKGTNSDLVTGLYVQGGKLIAVHNQFHLAADDGNISGVQVDAEGGQLSLKNNHFSATGSASMLIGLDIQAGRIIAAGNQFDLTSDNSLGYLIGANVSQEGQLRLENNRFHLDQTSPSLFVLPVAGIVIQGGQVTAIQNQFDLRTASSGNGSVNGALVTHGELTVQDNNFTLSGPKDARFQSELPKSEEEKDISIHDRGGNHWQINQE